MKYQVLESIFELNKELMYKEAIEDHLKKKYLACLNGPILFTAPHTKRLQRGGQLFKEKIRIHQRQIYTSFLASDLARMTGKNSFCIWGKSSVINEDDLDPNYLKKQLFERSPFHQCLHAWGVNHSERPILHVDVHGKLDREKNCEIDVGIQSMEVHWDKDLINWDKDLLINQIKKFFEKAKTIFEGLVFGKYPCSFNCDPDLHGYWGNGIHTMTEQAILLGIPSIQLEIPRQVRKKLFLDQKLRQKLANVIVQLYKEVIIPWHQNRKRKLLLQKQIASNFKFTIKPGKEHEEALTQIEAFEKKEESHMNGKAI